MFVSLDTAAQGLAHDLLCLLSLLG